MTIVLGYSSSGASIMQTKHDYSIPKNLQTNLTKTPTNKPINQTTNQPKQNTQKV